MKFFKLTLHLLAISFSISSAIAQNNTQAAALIAKSQSDNLNQVLFEISPKSAKPLDIDGFNNQREYNIRTGVPNFMKKCQLGKSVRIAYLGGSITASPIQYRTQSANFINTLFPNVKMTGISAGIGGTGADLGAARLHDQVLKYNPDLIFVEYAVNGSNENGVEGIIRQIIKHNPKIDICIIYTIYQKQHEIYTQGNIPANIMRLEKVAQYYNLPSIHMGMWPGMLQKEGKLLWTSNEERNENTVANPIIFSKDGVHAQEAGGDIYACSIARAFRAMKKYKLTAKDHLLPKPLLEHQMERAHFVYPNEISAEKLGWKRVVSTEDNRFKRFSQLYSSFFVGDSKSKPLEIKFKGDLFGFHGVGGIFGSNILLSDKTL